MKNIGRYLVKVRGKKIDFAKVPKGTSRIKLLKARRLPVWKGARLVVAGNSRGAINIVLRPKKQKLGRFLRRA